MKSTIRTCWSSLTCAAALLALAAAARSEPGAMVVKPAALHVLFLSGEGTQDWRDRTLWLRQLLADTERFDVRVCESSSGLTAETLRPFDVVVSDYLGSHLGSSTEKAVETFVASGKGLVILQGGLLSMEPAKAGAVIARLTKASWPSPNTNSLCAPFRVFEVESAHTEHPIMQGFKPTMRTGDQPCRGLTLESGVEVLASTEAGDPLIFVSSHRKGRVFCTALGHDLAALQEPAFVATFLRGVEWAASGRVTLPVDAGWPVPKAEAPRLLVITGGHDHEAAFYGLFNDVRNLGWAPVSDSKTAFQSDLRPKYDVLVMYDFTRDLGEKEQKILRDFVESGKGIVVLHHGILNFQHWPWWYEEVVGGRYRLQHEGGIPNSTVKFGEEHLITPVAGHPITSGVGPFHIMDETYKGLFISTNITPLLRTDNPTSDPVVGWIGPCKTSRVVFIQLGHDHTPFRHPSYRTLVRNSILWSAGKLN